MKKLLLLILLSSPVALAEDLQLVPVGAYGGYRVKTPCTLDGSAQNCMFDTASRRTILALTPVTANYPSLGKVELKGLGAIAFRCDRVRPNSFLVAGRESSYLEFLRCEGFPEESAPMIGIDYFRNQMFSFRFRSNALVWEEEGEFLPARFSMEGKNKSYLTFDGSLGANPAKIFFDTGAPVTMVSYEFVAAHPESFVRSDRPPSEMMKRNNFVAYEIQDAIVVQGVELRSEFIYAADLSPITGDLRLDIVLGVNHMMGADWQFNLKSQRFGVRR